MCTIAGCPPPCNANEPICQIGKCASCKVPSPCRNCIPKCCNTFLDFPILRRPLCRGTCSCCSPWQKRQVALFGNFGRNQYSTYLPKKRGCHRKYS